MSNRRIPMIKLKEIIRLKNENYSSRQIARTLKISRNTLQKYLSILNSLNLSFKELSEYTEESLFSIATKNVNQANSFDDQKHTALIKLFPSFELDLKKVGVTRESLWHDYRENSQDGYSYSQFCYHYQQWKKNSDITMHFEHKAGDKLFVDYAGSKLQVVNRITGEIRGVEVFVSILGSSQLIYVEASYSQEKENFIKSVENCVRFYGGVPKAIVPDNLKSAVTKSCKYEPILNASFDDFSNHYNTTILAARSKKPRDKALVESAVKIVYSKMYRDINKQTFFSIEELNTEIKKYLLILNNRKLTDREYSRMELFEQIERETLLPLPDSKFELKEYKFYKVANSGHIKVTCDKHYYSVPYRYIGNRVKVAISADNIEIYHNYTRIALHKRCHRFGYTTVKDHMASQHKYVAEWSPERFISWASKVGENTSDMIKKVLDLKQYPEQSYKSYMGILSYEKKVGKDRLEKACERAIYYRNYNYRIIKNILEKGLDKNFEPKAKMQLKLSQSHGNIRGKQYYEQPSLFKISNL